MGSPGLTASEEKTWQRKQSIPVWLRMLRFVNRGQARFRADLRQFGLSSAQFDIIAQVGRNEELTQSELAGKLVVTQGNVTQLLDKMQAAGLIVRHAQGRCNRIGLTSRGRELYYAVVPQHEDTIEAQFAALDDDEMETLSRLTRKLLRHMPVMPHTANQFERGAGL